MKTSPYMTHLLVIKWTLTSSSLFHHWNYSKDNYNSSFDNFKAEKVENCCILHLGKTGMMTLRKLSLIWKPHSSACGLFKTFSVCSSNASFSVERAENDQSSLLETKMKTYIKEGDIQAALQLFEESRKDSGFKLAWSVEGASSLLHMFSEHGEHKAVDRLYKDMQKNVTYIGEGAKTTVIKSYCNRHQFDKAIEMLHEITNDNMIHHTRHYDYVIKTLAQNGLTKKAFQLFDEKCQQQAHCRASRGDRCLTVDKEMIASLLNPMNIPQPLPKDGEGVASNRKCDDEEAAKRHKVYKGMSLKVFSYLQHAGVKLPGQLLQVIRHWFRHDPYYSWTWKNSKVSEIGMCSNCGNHLTCGIAPSEISQLECEIIKLSSCLEQNVTILHGKKLDKRMCQELDDFKQFVKQQGPFDVIIDGLNVGLHGSMANRKNMVFSTDRIKETARNFASQKKKVLLIIRHNALVWNHAQSLINNLENICSVYTNKFNNDDLYLLYAAAFSGMQQVQIVTNDRLRDHRLLLPINLWWTFLRWTRLNCVSFSTSANGKLKFFQQNFDPVVQRAGNSWHFPAKDDTWRCVTRAGLKKEFEYDSE